MKKDYIVGLDIGCKKIKASIAEVAYPEQQLAIIASLSGPSSGLKDGMVVDINNLSGSVSDILEKLSGLLNLKISSVVLNISGIGVFGEDSSGIVTLDQRSAEITQKDIKNVIAGARMLPLGMDREIIHVIPKEYKIDSQKGVKNPLGLYGTKLEVDAYIISAKISLIQNIVKCLNCAGVDAEEMVFSGLATGIAVLSDEEKKNGVILIDIGSDFTEISVFKNGNLIKVSVLKIGGNSLTEAISSHFRISQDSAEALKIRYGVVKPFLGNENAPSFSNFNGISFDQNELNKILYDNSKKILAEINKEIEPFKKIIFSGAIFAGGVSLSEGFLELSEAELGIRAKIAMPISVKGKTKDLSTIYSTSIGLVKHSFARKQLKPSSKNIKNRFKRSIVKAKELFYDYF